MNRIRDIFLTVAAAVIILQALAFGDAGRAIAQAVQQVFVTNTTKNPVPVNVRNAVVARVNNPVSAPVWVREAREARETVFGYTDIEWVSGEKLSSRTLLYQVPAGKQLVVEYVSARGQVPAGQAVSVLALISEGSTGIRPWYYFSPTFTGNEGNAEANYVVAQETQIRVQAGRYLKAEGERTSQSGLGWLNVTFSGYLVNVP